MFMYTGTLSLMKFPYAYSSVFFCCCVCFSHIVAYSDVIFSKILVTLSSIKFPHFMAQLNMNVHVYSDIILDGISTNIQ